MAEAKAIPPADLSYVRHSTIVPVAEAWDRFVPRDLPHLRAGFLQAVERGRMHEDAAYLMVHHAGELAGVALAYSLPLDTAASAPPVVRRIVETIRKVSPKFMWKQMRICGSPISNAESGVYLDPRLSPEIRREVFRRMTEEILEAGGIDKTYFFKEFDEHAVAEYASELEALGFFPNDPWAGTRLALQWNSFDGYLAALKKRYRKRIREELKVAERLELSLLDSFSDLAPTAAALYDQVFARADFAMEKATAGFFAAVSDFGQAKLLVARNRANGEVLGVNLLLFGDTCMHNLYIGFDYAQNEQFHTYFNLVIHSLRIALEHGCKVCYLGQDSYEFKARLGAKPVGLTAYMKHRLWPVHSMLKANRHVFFPKNEPISHDVFQGSGGDGD